MVGVTDGFTREVQVIIGPLLADLGLAPDGVDAEVDEGGRRGSVCYYRGDDCKIQVYWSPRDGEINCMIAPVDAPNESGLRNHSRKWHYLDDFVDRPSVPLERLVEMLKADKVNFTSHDQWLRWLRDRINQYFETARAGVLGMY
jgi:hypothetical protein